MRTVFLVILLIPVLLTSCANHLRTETLNDPKKVTSEPELEYFILLDSEVVNSHRISLKVEQLEKREVKDAQDISEVEFYTPYQGAREFYEFPVGVVLLPVAVVVNLTDFVLLGLIPDRITDKTLDMSFAGMNPALNIESTERSENKILKTYEKVIHVGEDIKRVPARLTDVTISSGENFKEVVKTDEKGALVIDLLSKNFLVNISDLRELNISAGKDKSEDKKTIVLARELSFNIKKAKKKLLSYFQSKSPEALAETIHYLEKELKFEKLGADLEKRELAGKDGEFKKAYEKKLESLFK
ncbi:MAG: hypothetical protein NE330_12480 [Lentisphaeraceae bacterium]|nr:hypothetical protein [Lentisphaeraceae bacterium]